MAIASRPTSGPGQLETLGSLFRGNFVAMPGFLAQCSRRYGPVSRFRILGRPTFFLDDAEAIGEVLVTKGRSFKKGRGLERMRILLGEGLLTSEEPLHLERRRLVQPAFHRERNHDYAQTIAMSTRGLISLWSDGERDVAGDLSRLTLEIASKALFGADVSADAADISASLTALLRMFPALMSPLGPLRAKLPLAQTRRFAAARDRLHRAVERIIAQRRGESADAGRADVLSLLMQARFEDGGRLDDRALRDESLTFLLAGHETTANALAWSLYLLAKHPAIQERAAREAAQTVGALAQLAPAGAGLVDAVIKESMRLYPPAWIIGRRAVEDVEIAGIRIGASSIVIMSPYVTHRNARYYDDPGDFRPQRWQETANLPRFAYFPFGGGNRVCIGEPFAWLELSIVLNRLLAAFRFASTPRTSGALQPIVTLRPKDGMVLALERR